MAVLPPNVFQTLVSTLQFGVGATGDDEVTQASLGCVKERAVAPGYPALCTAHTAGHTRNAYHEASL